MKRIHKQIIGWGICMVVCYLVLTSRPIQDFVFSIRVGLNLEVPVAIERAWENQPAEYLLRKMNSRNSTYANIAMSILAERKEKRAIPIILRMTKSYDEQTRISAFIALGEFGDKNVIPLLMKIIKQGKEGRDYINALRALSIMKYEPIYDKVVELALSGGDDSSYAVTMLEGVPENPVTIRTLEKVAKNAPEDYIRDKAKTAIEKIRAGKNGQKGTEMGYLKVEFYKILDEVEHTRELDRLLANSPEKFDRKKHMKTEQYVGSAEYKDGKVTIDVTDPELEKALKSPFTSMKGTYDKGVVTDEFVTLQPGTLEHLSVIRHELQGYSAITSTKEELGKEGKNQ